MTPTLARKKQQHVEDQIQMAVVQHLQLRGVPGLLFWYTPNGSKLGGARTKSGMPLAAIRGKKLGLLSGVSDLLFWRAGTLYALELKSPGGRPSIEQHAFLDSVVAEGGYAMWTDDLDRALDILESWGLLCSKSKQPGQRLATVAPTTGLTGSLP